MKFVHHIMTFSHHMMKFVHHIMMFSHHIMKFVHHIMTFIDHETAMAFHSTGSKEHVRRVCQLRAQGQHQSITVVAEDMFEYYGDKHVYCPGVGAY